MLLHARELVGCHSAQITLFVASENSLQAQATLAGDQFEFTEGPQAYRAQDCAGPGLLEQRHSLVIPNLKGSPDCPVAFLPAPGDDSIHSTLAAPLWARVALVGFAFAALAMAVAGPMAHRRARERFAVLAGSMGAPVTPGRSGFEASFEAECDDRKFAVRRELRSGSAGGSYRGPRGHLVVVETPLSGSRWEMHGVEIVSGGLRTRPGARPLQTGDPGFDARFTVWQDGRVAAQWRAGTPAQRLADVLGIDFVAGSRELDAPAAGPLSVRGRVGLPEVARSRSDQQYTYVNGRLVRVCCAGCVGPVKADPAAAFAKVDAAK